jgi:hypothetical protein
VILLAIVLSSRGKRSRGRSERVRRIVTPEGDPTVEAGETPSGGLGAELDRIGSAVDAGDTDLSRLGFWRVVALVKRDDELIDRYAEQVGRIDTKAFRAGVRLRIPVWAGNALLLGGAAAGAVAVIVAVRNANANPGQPASVELFSGLALLLAAGTWAIGLHSPTHWIVGRLVGIRFTDYFLGGPPPPRPGLKTDYATYLRASPMARAVMHASGAVATKLAPFLALMFFATTDAAAWARFALLGLGVLLIVTDVFFSTKTSDWKKVRREVAVARARKRVHTAGA